MTQLPFQERWSLTKLHNRYKGSDEVQQVAGKISYYTTPWDDKGSQVIALLAVLQISVRSISGEQGTWSSPQHSFNWLTKLLSYNKIINSNNNRDDFRHHIWILIRLRTLILGTTSVEQLSLLILRPLIPAPPTSAFHVCFYYVLFQIHYLQLFSNLSTWLRLTQTF